MISMVRSTLAWAISGSCYVHCCFFLQLPLNIHAARLVLLSKCKRRVSENRAALRDPSMYAKQKGITGRSV